MLHQCNYEECDYKTMNQSNFTRHVKTVHENSRDFICNSCHKTFNCSGSLHKHMQTHMQTHYDKQYKCELCDKKYTRKDILNRHIKFYHEIPGQYVCDVCHKGFNRSDELNVHQQLHTNRIYSCQFCDKIYTYLSSLNRHTNEVHKINQYICSFPNCDKSFSTKVDLTSHIHNIHHVIQCETCNFISDTIDNMTQHVDNHHTKKIHNCPCQDCSYTTTNVFDYKRHLTVHTNERPYICQQCSDGFKTIKTLQQHMLVHTDEHPHICDICYSSFKSKSRLTTHKRWHNIIRKFKCDLCDKNYTIAANLRRHITESHSNEMSIIMKKKENKVYQYFLQNHFDVLSQHRIDFKCANYDDTYCYIDLLILYNGIVFLIEVDEFQHKSYEVACEVKRMYNVFQSLMIAGNSLQIVFIRYNPDVYRINNKKQYIDEDIRLSELCQFISTFKPIQQFNIKYLYYNKIDNDVEITLHPDFTDEILQFVI